MKFESKTKSTHVLIANGTQYKRNFKTMYQLVPLQDKEYNSKCSHTLCMLFYLSSMNHRCIGQPVNNVFSSSYDQNKYYAE